MFVLDPACGSRMMWFDKADSRVVFGDIRQVEEVLCDGRVLSICPDTVMDFRCLPFAEETFYHVVFDPPHLKNLGKKSWTAQKYGVLFPSWKEDIAQGFAECFRVLKPWGTLIFKWSETQIPLSDVLALTSYAPLYGHRSGKHSRTHWVAFIKSDKDRNEHSP